MTSNLANERSDRKRSRTRRRRLICESLEDRRLLASDFFVTEASLNLDNGNNATNNDVIVKVDGNNGDRSVFLALSNIPDAISTGPSGDLFVALNDDGILKVDPNTAANSILSGPGVGTGTDVNLDQPKGIAFFSNGDLLVAEASLNLDNGNNATNNDVLVRIDGTNGNRSVFHTLNQPPETVVTGPSGDFFVALADDGILKVDANTAAGTIISGPGVGTGTDVNFDQPKGIAFFSNGDLLVAETSLNLDNGNNATNNDVLVRVDISNGNRSVFLTLNQPPNDIVTGPTGEFFVALNDDGILKVDPNTAAATIVSGPGVGGGTDVNFDQPQGIAFPASAPADTTPPEVTINQAGTQADPTGTSPIIFTAVFSEPVTGFMTGDVSLSGTAGATTGTVTEIAPNDGTTYQVAVSGMTGSGTVIATIGAGVAADAASNNNNASTSTDNEVTYDVDPPVITCPADATIEHTADSSSATLGTATATDNTDPAPVITESDNVTAGAFPNLSTIERTWTATDHFGLASNCIQTITIVDTSIPSVTIDQASTQADPTNASPILFTVVFSEEVTGFASGDVTLGGTAGATTDTVTEIAPMDGTTYSVAVSGMTGDGTVTASIGAGVAMDLGGNNNNASTSTDNTVTYDATAPTVTINQAGTQADPTNSSPINFTVVFSEPVTSTFASGDVTLAGTAGATTDTVTEIAPNDGTTYNVAVTGMTGSGTVIATIGAGVAADAVGNNNTASSSTDNVVTYDVDPPVITCPADATIEHTADSSPASLGSATATDNTDANPAITSSDNVVAGAFPNLSTIERTWTATDHFGLASNCLQTITLVDTSIPSVTINQAGTQADPTNASPINFTVVFSEEVTGFASGDVTLGGTAGATTDTVTEIAPMDGTTYNVAVTGMTGGGTVTASIGAGVAMDLGGNNNTASTSTDNTVTYDVTAPEVTINQAVGQTDPTNASSIIFTAVFSESVASTFASGDVSLSGSAGATTDTVTEIAPFDGTTYNVAVSGMTSDGTVVVSIGAGVASDAAGNSNNSSTSTDNTVTYDATAPTLVSFERFNPMSTPTNADVLVFRATFDEDVANVDALDFAVDGTTTATVSGVTPMTANNVYDITVSGGDLAGFNGTVGLDLAGGQDIEDLAGNPLPPGEPATDDAYDVVNVTAAPEFLVNDSTSGFQVTYAETRNVAANVAGDMVITYAGSGPGDSQGIFARRYDATNTPLGPAFLVNQTTTGNQTYSSTAVGPAGDFVVAWSGRGVGDNDGGVFIRPYDSSGTPSPGEIRVNQTTASFQQRPVVAKDSNGDLIVVWSGKGAGDTSGGVFMRRFLVDGTPVTGEILVNTTTSLTQQQPDIAIASDGSFVITWSGNGPGDPSGVFFQRFDNAGSPVGSETRVNTSISSQQLLPSVAIDGANNFTVVWSGFGNQSGQNDSRGVFMQRYNASGSPVGGEELVNTTTTFDQEDASISMPPSGAAVVSWTSTQAGQGKQVLAQEYSAAGAQVGGEILINSTTFLDQQFSSVAVRGETAYTVVWSGRTTGDTSGVSAATQIRMPVPLMAAGGEASGSGASNLTQSDLDAVVAAAVQRFGDAGLSQNQLSLLSAIDVQIADLSGARLGEASGGTITIDINAAGYGWFVDATPLDDEEFTSVSEHELSANSGSAADGRMDLLTAVMHEMGHILGLDHADEGTLLGETLGSGTRHLLDDVFAELGG